MKKIVLALVIMVACVASSQAINRVESGVINTINNETVFGRLSAYLKVTDNQAADLKSVIETTQIQLERAEKSGDPIAYAKALHYNFEDAANILSASQYAKYRLIVRTTIRNRYLDQLPL
jgi:hypothetical protein